MSKVTPIRKSFPVDPKHLTEMRALLHMEDETRFSQEDVLNELDFRLADETLPTLPIEPPEPKAGVKWDMVAGAAGLTAGTVLMVLFAVQSGPEVLCMTVGGITMGFAWGSFLELTARRLAQ